MPQHPELLETLRDAQRFGFFGARPMEEAVEHSSAYVAALETRSAPRSVIDLGSGGGLPGLVLADAFRHASIVLVDRREKRTDFLKRAASRLGFDHVEVVAADVEMVCRDVEAQRRSPFDVVTARGFGPPEITVRFARRLVAPDGVIVISEPPAGDRWPPALLDELRLESRDAGPVRTFHPR